MGSHVSESFGRCCVNPRFLDRFYEIFLSSHPAIKPMFQHTDMGKQKNLLRQGLPMVLMHGEGNAFGTRSLDRIAESHGRKGMNVDPNLYEYWINSLLEAIKECDPQWDPALEAQWRDVLQKGTKYIASQGR
ncbi:globin [Candidatus Nitrospira bockiana]